MDPLVLGKEQKTTRKYGKLATKRGSQNVIEEYQVKSKDNKGSKGHTSRRTTIDSQKAYYSEYYDPRNATYSNWSAFDGNRSNKKSNYDQGYGKYNDQYEVSNYAKNVKPSYNKAFYSDNNYSKSTQASSNSDGEASELNGFKIMMNGKVLHDETGEEFDSFNHEPVFQSFPSVEKFASSVMTIGPITNEISMPSFL
jgi:hypothetical protein